MDFNVVGHFLMVDCLATRSQAAAASGALKAAGDISTTAVAQVERAATGVIGGVKVVAASPFRA